MEEKKKKKGEENNNHKREAKAMKKMTISFMAVKETSQHFGSDIGH